MHLFLPTFISYVLFMCIYIVWFQSSVNIVTTNIDVLIYKLQTYIDIYFKTLNAIFLHLI